MLAEECEAAGPFRGEEDFGKHQPLERLGDHGCTCSRRSWAARQSHRFTISSAEIPSPLFTIILDWRVMVIGRAPVVEHGFDSRCGRPQVFLVNLSAAIVITWSSYTYAC